MIKVVKNTLGNFLIIFIIFSLITGWWFSGWPRILENPPLPPEAEETRAATQEYFSGTDSFMAQVTGNHIIVLVGGGGGGGGPGGSNGQGGGGGGGGGLCQITVSLTKDQSYAYAVGGVGSAGSGDGGSGGNTTFTVGATTYTAYGGMGGKDYNSVPSGAGGTGGTTSLNCDLNRTGGTGGTGGAGSAGGGSGAGTSGNGNPGSIPNGGAAVSDHGGKGGDGGTANNASGVAGEAYGGGGGGGNGKNGTAAAGYAGYIIITYNTPPGFTAGPDDNPDPVAPGFDVTFSATSTDTENDSWYLAVCKTESVTAGTPPICETDQTYCVSSSAVASGSSNTCTWSSTGSGQQTYYAFTCDNSSLQASCSLTSSSTITVQTTEVTCTTQLSETAFGQISINGIFQSLPDATTTVLCEECTSGFTMTIYSTGGEGSPGLYKSDATTDLINSADATLEAGTEGYGIQATTTSGDITIDPRYLLTGNNVGGLELNPGATLASSSAAILSEQMVTTIFKATVSQNNELGAYSDQATISCTVNNP